MIKIKLDAKTYLVVDFEGLLSPRVEEVTAYSFAGKSQSSISLITGTSQETIKKQRSRAYLKTDVDGLDSPLPALMCKSFQNGWAKFVVTAMLALSVLPSLRVNFARTNTFRPELSYAAS